MAMKRKASSAFKDDDEDAAGEPRRAPPQLGDYLIAEEILPRLPARAAAACAVGPLRGILTGVDYWRVRNPRRLPRPRAACLVVAADSAAGAGFRHEFHYADAAFPAEPAAVHAAGRTLAAYCYGGTPPFRRLRRGFYAPFSRVPAVHAADGRLAPYLYGAARFVDDDRLFSEHPAVARAAGGTLGPFRYASTCNGLVLLTSPWDNTGRARAVLFNPATGGEEETIVLDMACGGGGKDVLWCFCGLGYSPSSKTYKAHVCARDFSEDSCAGELVAVPFGGGGGGGGPGDEEKPRTVAKLAKLSERGEDYFSSISLDGKVCVLADISPAAAVLAFDVDDETVTEVPMPQPWRVDKGYVSELMELWGRPCIAMGDRDASTLWTLTPEHRWERRCTLAAAAPGDDDFYNYDHATIHGAWDCGDGFFFALFRDGRGFMYDIQETETTTPGGGGLATHARRLPEAAAAKSSAATPMAELLKATFCWGYQPTLVRPATVFGGYVCPEKRDGLRHFSSGRPNWIDDGERRRCLEELMEMMRKRPQRREEHAAGMMNNE